MWGRMSDLKKAQRRRSPEKQGETREETGENEMKNGRRKGTTTTKMRQRHAHEKM